MENRLFMPIQNILFKNLAEKLHIYLELLREWNSRMDLTAVLEDEETVDRHFIDSLTVLKTGLIGDASSLIDVGTGAGFPGLVLAMANPELRVTLLDAQQKRLDFIQAVCEATGTANTVIVHARAEDGARRKELREQFDIATSRAVANLSTLSEYCLPFVNINGTFVSYKSGIVDDELSLATNAIRVLGGDTPAVERYSIPFTEYDRSLCFINKRDHTADKYPRRSGIPLKKPL